jgi:hypothetical protein
LDGDREEAAMRWPVICVTVTVAGAALAAAVPASAVPGRAVAPARVAAAWGAPQHLPGLDALGPGGAYVQALSCAVPGDCTAGGYYIAAGHQPAFVDSEVNGKWARAREVPAGAALNVGLSSAITSVSCTGPGDCVAGGSSNDAADAVQAIVVSEVNGNWASTAELPGLPALNTGGDAQVNSMSCAARGDCTVTGSYTINAHPPGGGSDDVRESFVATETRGTWGSAIELPGSDVGGTGSFTSTVSCPKPGDCVVAGGDSRGAFVAVQSGGRWHAVRFLPGVAAGITALYQVSCPAVGYCTAVGTNASTANQVPIVADEVKGAWRSQLVPGYAALNAKAGAIGQVANVLSCASPGNCTTGGTYHAADGATGLFVASEVRGSWGKARQLPGALHGGWFTALSCGLAGDCAAGGLTEQGQAFVADQVGGAWQKAKVVASMHELNGLSCVPALTCVAVGSFGDFSTAGPGAVLAN